jgi:hypothetical protein
MKLSIIIVNFNGKDLTLNCLESIYSRLESIDFEVIVVDNASHDGSLEAISSEFPEVITIKNASNLGFSKANNEGIKIAKGDYILLLNNDTLLEGGNFNNLINYTEDNMDVGILGCRINNSDGSLQLSCYRFPGIWEMFTHYAGLTKAFPNSRLFGDHRNWPHNEIREVDFVIGAFFLVKRSIFDGIGLLDEDFFLNAEETEFCLRAKKAGFKTVFHPGYTITHLGGATKKDMKEKDAISHIKGTQLLIRKHHTFIYYLLYNLVALILSCIRVFIFGLFSMFSNSSNVRNNLTHSRYLILYLLGINKDEF